MSDRLLPDAAASRALHKKYLELSVAPVSKGTWSVRAAVRPSRYARRKTKAFTGLLAYQVPAAVSAALAWANDL